MCWYSLNVNCMLPNASTIRCRLRQLHVATDVNGLLPVSLKSCRPINETRPNLGLVVVELSERKVLSVPSTLPNPREPVVPVVPVSVGWAPAEAEPLLAGKVPKKCLHDRDVARAARVSTRHLTGTTDLPAALTPSRRVVADASSLETARPRTADPSP